MVPSVKRALRITPMLNRLTCDDTDERWAATRRGSFVRLPKMRIRRVGGDGLL